MHDGCSAEFEDGKAVVDKVRMMGFSEQSMPIAMTLDCKGCRTQFEMETFEAQCPECGAVHAVTPCHAFDPDNVQSAGVGY
ncbi:hypothetical protein ACXJY6_03120 [Vibrio sp. RC27]